MSATVYRDQRILCPCGCGRTITVRESASAAPLSSNPTPAHGGVMG